MDKHEQPTTNEVISNGSSAPRKGGLINTLYPPGPRGGFGPRAKNHCRKFWWCDLLVIAIVTLVIVLPIVFVGIPHIAQNDINDSTLEVTEQDVTAPTPDGVHLKLNSVAHSGSSFHPTLDGFSAGLSLPNAAPFFYINLPSVKTGSETDINVEQDVTFADKNQFIEFSKVALKNESFDIHVDGKTKLHQSGLKAISVDYNKVVTMKGLNGLDGLNITYVKILSGKTGDNALLPDGSNMMGTVYIPNTSVMTLEMGNLTMNLACNGTKLGYAIMNDITIKPGNNTVDFHGTVDQITILGLITSQYKDGVIPFNVTGNSSVYNGQNLEYYTGAIQSNWNIVNLNLGPALAAININITSSA